MSEYLSPGVYMEEFESGTRPISGVSTSVVGFIGLTEKGSINEPQLITNMGDFARLYGGFLSKTKYGDLRYLPYAVDHFFTNGGSKCYVMRVGDSITGNTAYWSAEEDSDTKKSLLDINVCEQYKTQTKDISITFTEQEGKKFKLGCDSSSYKILNSKSEYIKEICNGDFVNCIINGENYIKQIKTIQKEDEGYNYNIEFFSVGKDFPTKLDENATINVSNIQMKTKIGVDVIENNISLNHLSQSYVNNFNNSYVEVHVQTKVLQECIHSLKENNSIPLQWLIPNTQSDKTSYTIFCNYILKVYAKGPGEWGNKINLLFRRNQLVKTSIISTSDIETDKYTLLSVDGFEVGDYVEISLDNNISFCNIVEIDGNNVRFASKLSLSKAAIVRNCKLDIEISYNEIKEKYENVSFNAESSDYFKNRLHKSLLVDFDSAGDQTIFFTGDEDKPYDWLFKGKDPKTYQLYSGKEGSLELSILTNFYKEAIKAYEHNDIVSIITMPGITDIYLQNELINHCSKMKNRFAILDLPKNCTSTSEIQKIKDSFNSPYAAIYHPWIKTYDLLSKKTEEFPPSGAVSGVFARTDIERGVFKAPANEIVKGATGLSYPYNKEEQGILNQKGVNLIRYFPGQGILVWGARTTSNNGLWKYVNVKRLFIYLEESIRENTNWIVFEPNDELLWIRVKRTIEIFLETVWRTGALVGSSKEEAFYVNIGRSTMSQDDIDNGRLICEIGVAPVKPAEFVIFRITQITNGA